MRISSFLPLLLVGSLALKEESKPTDLVETPASFLNPNLRPLFESHHHHHHHHHKDEDEDQKKVRKPKLHRSFLLGLSTIVVSEIGDKSFLIAAIMSMRYSRHLVFSAAFSALAIMTILSGLMGHILPALLSPILTQFCASVLFFVFGTRIFMEAMQREADAGIEDDVNEVKGEISMSKINERNAAVETGEKIKPKTSTFQILKQKIISCVFTPAWIQTFSLTFLGEWGDRSQIAIIALAAGSDWSMVTFGGVIGHGICTALATIGGQFLASRISVKTVLIVGSITFYLFGFSYLYSSYSMLN